MTARFLNDFSGAELSVIQRDAFPIISDVSHYSDGSRATLSRFTGR